MTIITPTVPRRTRGKLARTLSASVAAAALVASALGSASAEDAGINEALFDAQSTFFAAIVKVANDGNKWTTVLPGSVGFDAHMKVDTKWPGYVERVGVWLGQCNGTECGSFQQVLSETPMQRDYDVNRSISFPTEDLVKARAGATNYGALILNRCNTRPVTERHGFQMTIDATFSANTRKATDESGMDRVEVGTPFHGGDVTRHDTFQISVECLATSKSTANPNPDPHRTKVDVQDIDLFLSAYAVPQSGPRGTTCKPLKVTTRIGTDKAGAKNVMLWRQVNGGPITSEEKQMHAEALGGGKFGDDWNKFEHFTQTTTVQYKAEILGGTFAPSTPWKSITIHCNGDFKSPTNDQPSKPKGEVRLPPTIVTPPPACGTKAAKVRGSAPCVKTAQLPDKRKQAAEQKRKAAQEAELRRREAALKTAADVRRQDEVRRPHHFGRFAPHGGAQRGFGQFRPQMMFVR